MGPSKRANNSFYGQYVVEQDDWGRKLRSLPTSKRKMAALTNNSWVTTADSTGTDTTQYITFFNDSNSTSGTSITATTDNYLFTGNKIVHTPSYSVASAPAPRADPRILNKYLNGSDLLEEFILDMKPMGIRQNEILQVPIELFINWMIMKSAEAEDAEIPALSQLPTKRRDRCWECGQFVTLEQRKASMFFCSGAHFDRYALRAVA